MRAFGCDDADRRQQSRRDQHGLEGLGVRSIVDGPIRCDPRAGVVARELGIDGYCVWMAIYGPC